MTAGKLYKIGDLARLTGKTPRALRLYEELGLLVPRRRTSGNFRLYGEEAIDRIAWVEKLQTLGLSLTSLADLLKSLCDGRPGGEVIGELTSFFDRSVTLVDERIARLERLREELLASRGFYQQCLDCTETNVLDSCRSCERTEDPSLPGLVKGLIARCPCPEACPGESGASEPGQSADAGAAD